MSMPLINRNQMSVPYTRLTSEEETCQAASRTESFGRRCLAWVQSRFCCFAESDAADQETIGLNRRTADVLKDNVALQYLSEGDNRFPDGAGQLTRSPTIKWGEMVSFNSDEKALASLFGFVNPEELRAGAFGTVYKYSQCSNEGEKNYAVKIHHASQYGREFSYHGGDGSCDDDFKNRRGEQIALMLPCHPGIATVHALVMQDRTNGCYGPIRRLDDLNPEDYKKLQLKMVVSDYVKGMDLHDLISGARGLSGVIIPRGGLSLAKKLALQLSVVLEFLHDQKVIYRDLKSENVMVALSKEQQRVLSLTD